jgi:hypothetical protein
VGALLRRAVSTHQIEFVFEETDMHTTAFEPFAFVEASYRREQISADFDRVGRRPRHHRRAAGAALRRIRHTRAWAGA